MTATKVTAYRRVCNLCGEHNGEYYDTAEDANDDNIDDGWTINEDFASCDACNEAIRQARCATEHGHLWDTTQNRDLAGGGMWKIRDQKFVMRHCGRDCGRTEMRQRDGDWFGFDRYGWLGDHQGTREERRRMRDSAFRV